MLTETSAARRVTARSRAGDGPRHRVVPGVVVLLAATATLGGASCSRADSRPVLASPAPPAWTAPAVSDATFLVECVEDAVVRMPRSFTLTCADGNESLDALVWSGWGQEQSTARGNVVSNTCEPTCAHGTTRSDPVEVVASRLVRREASQVYTRLTVRYVGPPPPGVRATEIYDLPS